MVMSSDKPPQLVNYEPAATIEHCRFAVKTNGFPKGHILPTVCFSENWDHTNI